MHQTKQKAKNRYYSLEKKTRYFGWIFVAPSLVGLICIFIPSLIQSIQFSFGKVGIIPGGYELNLVGFANYSEILFLNPDFIQELVASLGTMLMEVPVVIMFSLFIGILLCGKLKGRTVFRVIFFMPVILATGIIEKAELNNMMLSSMSNISSADIGTVQAGASMMSVEYFEQIFLSLGLSPEIGEYVFSVVNNIYNIITRSGIQILIFISAFQSIPNDLHEAAKVEGATEWEYFWKVAFPTIFPYIFVNVVYTIIDFLTRSSNSIITLINDRAFSQGQFGEASAMTWIYSLIVILLTALIFLFFNRKAARR